MATAAAAPSIDAKSVLEKEEVAIEDLVELMTKVHSSIENRKELEKVYGNFGSIEQKLSSENRAAIRRGVIQYMLGDTEGAAKALEAARTSRERDFFLALALRDLRTTEKAIEILDKLHDADKTSLPVFTALVEARIAIGDVAGAAALIGKIPKALDGKTETTYLQAYVADFQGRYQEADALYKKVLDAEPEHPKALFRLAYNYDLRGDDEESQKLYDRLRKVRPPFVNGTLNLGILYEDRGEYQKALECYQNVLDAFPNHQRAQLYAKDAVASLNMYYNEEAKKREHRWSQVLSTPLTDFQLSVRVRKALEKLAIRSLGDLVKKSEEELMGCKNFGETSLRELRELLAAKGLAFATPGADQAAKRFKAPAAGGAAASAAPIAAPIAKEEVYKKPLNDYEWSARAKKAFERLEIHTFGELASKTENDLLACKNFGVTSLNEVKDQLRKLGLNLASGE